MQVDVNLVIFMIHANSIKSTHILLSNLLGSKEKQHTYDYYYDMMIMITQRPAKKNNTHIY
jgi:hypothetical protein